jgi:hypothetical protein
MRSSRIASVGQKLGKKLQAEEALRLHEPRCKRELIGRGSADRCSERGGGGALRSMGSPTSASWSSRCGGPVVKQTPASAIRRTGSRRLVVAGALSAVLVVGLFALARWVRVSTDWPTAKSDNLLLIGVLVVGMIPTELLLVDALIRRGGKLSFTGVTIDLAAAGPVAVDYTIDTNIGVTGETVSDTSSENILDALRRSAKTDVVLVNLGDGKAWWETRLLVLAAGGARTGKPRAVVFVTSERGQSGTFLGWAPPGSLLEALFEPSNPRHTIYRKAHADALHAAEKWQKAIDELDNKPPGTVLATPAELTEWPWNWEWVAWRNGRANPFAPEQFLAIDLGRKIEETWRASKAPPDASPTEKFPNAVTITEENVRSQFGRQLHRTAIEEGAGREDPVSTFLADTGEFVAITQAGSYVRLAPRSAVLERLVQQLLVSSLDDSG